MNNLIFLPQAWVDYVDWQDRDKKICRRINQILKDIARNPFDGIGKPEPLKGNLSGYWSRRIDGTNRVVYRVQEGGIVIAQCKGHY